MTTGAFWPLAESTWTNAEIEAAIEVLRSGVMTMGARVTQLEREIGAYFGSRHVVMANSGSSANLLAVAALAHHPERPLRRGDEVVVPAVAWATTYAPLHQYGLRLRVVDVNPHTLNADAAVVKEALTRKTRAIVGVSILGNPAELDAMRALADERGLRFIEDNCESVGARIGAKFTGTFGHVGTLSTFFSHHMNTVEGGFLLTDDEAIATLARQLRAHGWTRETGGGAAYDFVVPGYNVRPTEIAAAVGRVQLRRLVGMNAVRVVNHVNFCRLFAHDARWRTQRPHERAVPFGFTFVLRTVDDLDRVRRRMSAVGIEHRMITGGNFARHRAARWYEYSVVGDTLPHADAVHYRGFFVGNLARDLSPQFDALRAILDEELI